MPSSVFHLDGEDDDFVRTISDHDSVLVRSEDEEIQPTTTANPPKSRKRKIDARDDTATATKTSKKHKKSEGEQYVGGNRSMGLPSDDEVEDPVDWTAQGHDDGAMDSEFEFDVQGADKGLELFNGWGSDVDNSDHGRVGQGNKKGVDIDELIARRRGQMNGAVNGEENSEAIDDMSDLGAEDKVGLGKAGSGSEVNDNMAGGDEDETLAEDAFGMGAASDVEDSGADGDHESAEDDSDSESVAVADDMPEPSDAGSVTSVDDVQDTTEKARRDDFFAPEDPTPSTKSSQSLAKNSFQTFSLSRPILRGLTSTGFTKPTPIQSRTIPVALLGKDVVGGAVTGSGKTAAFIIPIIERLLYRPKKIPTSRVAILTPTRELAVQCFNVARKLASFTDITFCQLVGGFSLREQESVLRSRPDVIIATPGRFIDHMRNSPSFTVDTLEILVLDEADRMLEEGFADELNEILTTIPKSRQTMLFSATMTSSVDKLIRVGLSKPVRLLVDARKQTVTTLTQEFVRLRPGREGLRLAYLLYLCSSIFTDRTIVFFRQKREVHRVRIIFALLGIKAAELHGSMSQEQRIGAITSFTSHTATHLLATDLASRGLDIPAVSTVLNYSAPQTHEIYLHRVGRTARAGRIGRSCTLAAEGDRKIVKQIVKSARAQGAKVVSRGIDTDVITPWQQKVEELDREGGEVEAILQEEKEERALQGQEMLVRKGENLIEHEDEIKARGKRTWFATEKEKERAKKRGREELNGPAKVGAGAKRGKLSGKEKKRRDDHRERTGGRMWKKGKGEGDVKGEAKMGPGKMKAALGKSRAKPRKGGREGGRGGRR